MKVEEIKQPDSYKPRTITITIESKEEENFFKNFGNLCGADFHDLILQRRKFNQRNVSGSEPNVNESTKFLNAIYNTLFV